MVSEATDGQYAVTDRAACTRSEALHGRGGTVVGARRADRRAVGTCIATVLRQLIKGIRACHETVSTVKRRNERNIPQRKPNKRTAHRSRVRSAHRGTDMHPTLRACGPAVAAAPAAPDEGGPLVSARARARPINIDPHIIPPQSARSDPRTRTVDDRRPHCMWSDTAPPHHPCVRRHTAARPTAAPNCRDANMNAAPPC